MIDPRQDGVTIFNLLTTEQQQAITRDVIERATQGGNLKLPLPDWKNPADDLPKPLLTVGSPEWRLELSKHACALFKGDHRWNLSLDSKTLRCECLAEQPA